MGDSLAAGIGANPTTNGYVGQVYRHELARYPGLRLVNLSCSGATTQSVVAGGGCSYSSGSQLGDAESFLRAHAGQVAFLTMDIGTNDVDSCIQKSGIDATCIQGGVSHVSSELPEILGGLTGSYAGLVIYGMDYYDPICRHG
jgi:lysophospholipase L1-like esterase